MLKPSKEMLERLAYLEKQMAHSGVTPEQQQKEQLQKDSHKMAQTGVPIPYSFC